MFGYGQPFFLPQYIPMCSAILAAATAVHMHTFKPAAQTRHRTAAVQLKITTHLATGITGQWIRKKRCWTYSFITSELQTTGQPQTTTHLATGIAGQWSRKKRCWTNSFITAERQPTGQHQTSTN